MNIYVTRLRSPSAVAELLVLFVLAVFTTQCYTQCYTSAVYAVFLCLSGVYVTRRCFIKVAKHCRNVWQSPACCPPDANACKTQGLLVMKQIVR